MAGVFQTVTFMVLVFTAVVVLAEDYDVGGESEWMRPTTLDFYTTWATGKTFRVGDELEFDFVAGRHDVAVVTKDAYENCDKMKPISQWANPPVNIRLNTTGPQYFICTIGDHCRSGQKLSINVVNTGAAPGSGATPGAGGGAATPAPGSSPGVGGTTPPTAGGTTTPSGSSGTTTPAGNVASSLGGAPFLVAFVSAIVALF